MHTGPKTRQLVVLYKVMCYGKHRLHFAHAYCEQQIEKVMNAWKMEDEKKVQALRVQTTGSKYAS